jgi:hypothetical protein
MKSFSQTDLLNDIVNENDANPEEHIINCETSNTVDESPAAKQGICLPKSSEDWALANAYFHANLPHVERNSDLHDIVTRFNDIVYNYFLTNFGTKGAPKATDNHLKEKYAGYKKGQLKMQLKHLKASNASTEEIRLVSKLYRSTLKRQEDPVTSIDHDAAVKKNFWSYCKTFIDRKIKIKPCFDKDACFAYFKQYLTKYPLYASSDARSSYLT